ncbi:MAG: hypothetical protein ABIP54_02160 [Candidatus Andersenbacteria bacterium]
MQKLSKKEVDQLIEEKLRSNVRFIDEGIVGNSLRLASYNDGSRFIKYYNKWFVTQTADEDQLFDQAKNKDGTAWYHLMDLLRHCR